MKITGKIFALILSIVYSLCFLPGIAAANNSKQGDSNNILRLECTAFKEEKTLRLKPPGEEITAEDKTADLEILMKENKSSSQFYYIGAACLIMAGITFSLARDDDSIGIPVLILSGAGISSILGGIFSKKKVNSKINSMKKLKTIEIGR